MLSIKKTALTIFLLAIQNYCKAQSWITSKTIVSSPVLNPIQQVDSVALSNGTSKHFADLYRRSMKNIEKGLESADGSTRSFVTKFEWRFAKYFLDACIAERNNTLVPSSPWKTYFSNSDAEPWQLALVGVNVHVNTDFHKALTDEFTEQEIKTHKQAMLKIQSSVLKEYDPLFQHILTRSSYLRFINTISLGLGKKFGEWTLYKWRKRQVKLAILFYRHPKKYENKLHAISRKKDKIDRKILQSIPKKKPVILPREPFHQLDSIGKSNSHSKHFGRLYHQFLTGIEEQLGTRDSAAQKLVRRFEKNFAGFYINACQSYLNKEKIDLQEWQAYFSDSALQPIQYLLLGANAHLNGGLWNALVKSFTAQEMKHLQPEFHIFKRSLNKTYKQVYKKSRENIRLKILGAATVGLDNLLGNFYLYKWRKRQMKIARLYWNHSPRIEKLVKKVDKRKRRIDQLITTLL